MSADPRMGVLESCRGKVDGSSGIRAVRNRGNLAARARVFTAIQHEASQRVHVVDEGSASESACSSPDVISGSYYDNEEIQEQSLEDSIAEAEALLESMALNGRILNGNENQDRVEDVNNDIVDGIFPKYSMESEDSLLEPLPTSSSVEICAATQRLAVVLRKRPLISSERSAGESDIVKVDPKTQKVILSVEKKQWDGGKFNEHTSFVFDQVYDEKSSNAAIYRTSVRPLVDDFLEGGHPSCFVYGATASGKSYTMFGTPRREGIVWLAARDIFSRKAANVSVFLSFFEIHLNRLSDLLHQKSRVRMVEDANGTFKFLGLKEIPCLSLDELMSNVREGNLLRTTSANKRNRLSSRGHAVVQMNAVDSEGNRVGRISFVDLAGSERGCDINPRNKALFMEHNEINRDFLALKNCIRAKQMKIGHIPFRQSKLTQVLRDSFMGNHPSVMIATISPSSSSFENTINSMRYAFRVKSMEEDGDSCANFKHTFMIAHEVTRDQGSLKAGAAVTPVKSRRSSQCTTLSSSRRRRTKSDVMAEKILPEYSKSSSTTSKHRDSRSGDSEGSITKPTFSSSRLRSSLVKSPATETESAPKLKYVSRALELVEMHKEVFDVLTRSLQQDLSLIHRKMNQNMDDVRYVDELGELVAVKEAALSKLKLTLTNLYTV